MSDKQELFQYYNERASEYEAFYEGKPPARMNNPEFYKNDTLAIQRLLSDHVRGRCLDIGCGTGFWLPVYEKTCFCITLVDQSENVLEECRKKIDDLGIMKKTRIIRGDIFDAKFDANTFDCVFTGFFISHLKDDELVALSDLLRRLLVKDGSLVIIDSTWNQELETTGRNKAGYVGRTLYDGREFEIYKRYFDREDLPDISSRLGIDLDIIYWGNVFFLAAGRFTG